MKTFFIGLLLYLDTFAIELIENIETQLAAKNSYYSLRIDDKFDDVIINATVIKPSFLQISQQNIEFEVVSEIKLDNNVKDLVMFYSKIFVLGEMGIDVYDLSYLWNPVLVQRYFDAGLKNFSFIDVGEVILVAKKKDVVVLHYKEGMFPERVGNIEIDQEPLFMRVVKTKVLLFFHNEIRVYAVVDAEIGWIELVEKLSFSSVFGRGLYINDFYLGKENFYLLEDELGVLEFSFFPVKFLKKFQVKGKKLAGHESDLCIDGRVVVNMRTMVVKYYSVDFDCVFLGIDSEFIYCGYAYYVLIVSRLLLIEERKDVSLLYEMIADENMVLLLNRDKFLYMDAQLGPLYIQGKTPDSVKDYKVEFQVSSITGNLTEIFVLSVQYSFADVIILILLSFISIFLLVFACSCVMKFINRVPKEDPPPEHISTEPQAYSSDRNVLSDRNLIRK